MKKSVFLFCSFLYIVTAYAQVETEQCVVDAFNYLNNTSESLSLFSKNRCRSQLC